MLHFFTEYNISNELMPFFNREKYIIFCTEYSKVNESNNLTYIKTNENTREDFIFGDLHGSWIKLISILSKLNYIKLIDFNELMRLYDISLKSVHRSINQKIEQHLDRAFNNIQNINNHKRIILIGDTLSDRGTSDCLTLYIYKLMFKNRINFRVVFSNHDLNFIYQLYGFNMIDESCTGSFDLHKNKLPMNKYNDYIAIYRDIYLRNLVPFIKYTNNTKDLLITHAPITPDFDETKVSKGLESIIDNFLNCRKIKDVGEYITSFVWNRDLYKSANKQINIFGHVGQSSEYETKHSISVDTNYCKDPSNIYNGNGDLKFVRILLEENYIINSEGNNQNIQKLDFYNNMKINSEGINKNFQSTMKK